MRRCQRQFGYGYLVAAHASSGRRREAYVLKQLKHFSAWQGSVVHETLATVLLLDLIERRGLSVERLSSAAADLATRQFAFSAEKRYREDGQTKSAAGDEFCALFEHEYGWTLPDSAPAQVAANARECFERLLSQRDFLDLLARGSQFESELTLTFRLDGATVAATFDLAFRSAAGRLTIVDWKISASESSDYSRQLLVYALVALRSGHWPALRPEEIDLYEVNLIRGEVRTVSVSQATLAEAEDLAYRGVVEMRALVESASDEDLSGLDLAGSPRTCVYCNFGPMCVSDLVKADAEPTGTLAVQGHLFS